MPRPAPARPRPPPAKRRKGEASKAPVRKARTSYKPKTAGPTSTESPRLLEIHARLDRFLRSSFRDVQPTFAYGIHGWVMPRRRKVAWTSGTMDPNFVVVALAERAQGISVHVWNPLDWDLLKSRQAWLKEAGFKVMVGCLQFNRKSEFPLPALERLLAEVARQVAAEGTAWPTKAKTGK